MRSSLWDLNGTSQSCMGGIRVRFIPHVRQPIMPKRIAYYASTANIFLNKKFFDVFGPFMRYMRSGTHLELTRVKNDP